MDRYRICVSGRLDPQWSDWFAGMEIVGNAEEPSLTVLDGMLPDQAALRGILNHLWDLNLSILSVVLLDKEGNNG